MFHGLMVFYTNEFGAMKEEQPFKRSCQRYVDLNRGQHNLDSLPFMYLSFSQQNWELIPMTFFGVETTFKPPITEALHLPGFHQGG